MITKNEIVTKLGISRKTLDNWKVNRPLLYEIVMNYFGNEEVNKKCDICDIYEQLNEDEKRLYRLEMEARILRNKLDNKK